MDPFTAMVTSALEVLDHDVSHGSASVLRERLAAELEVKRAVLDQHQQTCGADHLCVTCHVPYPCPTLRLHAHPFANHKDYDQRWAIPKP